MAAALGAMMALLFEPPTPPIPRVGGTVPARTTLWHSRQVCASRPLMRAGSRVTRGAACPGARGVSAQTKTVSAARRR